MSPLTVCGKIKQDSGYKRGWVLAVLSAWIPLYRLPVPNTYPAGPAPSHHSGLSQASRPRSVPDHPVWGAPLAPGSAWFLTRLFLQQLCSRPFALSPEPRLHILSGRDGWWRGKRYETNQRRRRWITARGRGGPGGKDRGIRSQKIPVAGSFLSLSFSPRRNGVNDKTLHQPDGRPIGRHDPSEGRTLGWETDQVHCGGGRTAAARSASGPGKTLEGSRAGSV